VAVGGTTLQTLATRVPASAAGWWVPAEEAAHRRTWMAWPSSTSIWGSRLLPRIQGDIARLAKAIARHEPVIMLADGPSNAKTARNRCGPNVTVIASIPVNDCWVRDSGPLFRTNGTGERDAIGLNFNGWGAKQKAGKDRHVAARIAALPRVGLPFAEADVVGEGGGIEYDGDGTIMATESCWVNPNRNPGKTRDQIEAELLARFGATKMIWVSAGIRGRDITDAHIDATSRFVRPGVVAVQVPPAGRTDVWAADARAQLATLQDATDARGRPLQIIRIDGPDVLPRWPEERWDTFVDSYVNWVVTNSAVITVQFGDAAKDAAARSAIRSAFPGRSVVQLNLDQLHGEGGGGAHCVTMQEPMP